MPLSGYLQFGYFVSNVIAYVLFYLIWSYLNKKALGMQTLYDIMIKDVMKSFLVSQAIVFLAVNVLGNLAPLPHWIAFSVAVLSYLSGFCFFLVILSSFLVRFALIYGIEEKIEENNIIIGVRLLNCILATIFTMIDFHFKFMEDGDLTLSNPYFALLLGKKKFFIQGAAPKLQFPYSSIGGGCNLGAAPSN